MGRTWKKQTCNRSAVEKTDIMSPDIPDHLVEKVRVVLYGVNLEKVDESRGEAKKQ